ncbi:MAG: hypothetical protein RL707_1868 [Pseudomonadota bacterium]
MIQRRTLLKTGAAAALAAPALSGLAQQSVTLKCSCTDSINCHAGEW